MLRTYEFYILHYGLEAWTTHISRNVFELGVTRISKTERATNVEVIRIKN